jgi:hypothetical protein
MQFLSTTIMKYFQERPLFLLNRPSFLRENSRLIWISLLFFIVVLVVRSWQNFAHPGLYAEDATYYFKINYNAEFLFENIFRNPNGYYNIANNFIAQILGDIDVRLQPFSYQLVAFSFSVLSILLFSRLGLITNKSILFITPLVLGLSGFNHIFYYITITFQMYVLVITLFAVLLLEQQTSKLKSIFLYIAIPILVWSAPYSVLAVPFALVFIFLFRGKTMIMLWTIAVTIAYALTTTGSTIMLQNIFARYFQVLWFETLMRDIFLLGLRQHVNIEKVILLFCIIVPALYAIRRQTFHLKILLLLMVVIIASMAPLFLSKKYIMYGSVYPCHLFVGKFFWLLSLLIIIDRLLEVSPYNYRKFFTATAVGVVLLFVVVDNIKHPEIGSHEVLYNMPKFLNTIHESESLHPENLNETHRFVAEGSGRFTPVAIVGSRSPDAKLTKTWYFMRNGAVITKELK